jgi:hypothetical protein
MNYHMAIETFKYNCCLIPELILWFKIPKSKQSLNSYQNRATNKTPV